MKRLLFLFALLWPACVHAQAGFDIVVLGEVHDNPSHHAEQARIVSALQPKALVWEMLPSEAPMQIQGIDRADAGALDRALGWEDLRWPDFAMYAPIFAAAPTAAVYGAAATRDDLRRAMAQGVRAAIGDRAAATLGLRPLDPTDLAARIAEQHDAHCGALPASLLPGMVEAQRFRDALLAVNAIRAFDENRGPVVVITGTGHARNDRGVPYHIRTARPDLRVWSLGQVEGEVPPDAPFDAVRATPVIPRPDPCAGLGEGG